MYEEEEWPRWAASYDVSSCTYRSSLIALKPPGYKMNNRTDRSSSDAVIVRLYRPLGVGCCLPFLLAASNTHKKRKKLQTTRDTMTFQNVLCRGAVGPPPPPPPLAGPRELFIVYITRGQERDEREVKKKMGDRERWVKYGHQIRPLGCGLSAHSSHSSRRGGLANSSSSSFSVFTSITFFLLFFLYFFSLNNVCCARPQTGPYVQSTVHTYAQSTYYTNSALAWPSATR